MPEVSADRSKGLTGIYALGQQDADKESTQSSKSSQCRPCSTQHPESSGAQHCRGCVYL